MPVLSIKEKFEPFVYNLQDQICEALEKFEPEKRFKEDLWDREGGGGGRTRVIEKGEILEKGGVNCSSVHGELPEPVRVRFGVEKGDFFATGVSLVVHPESPLVPTVHANFRYFELYDDEGDVKDAWFGGGADLTPYYLWQEDAIHFHKVLKQACDRHDESFYPRFKKDCDEYFYNSHRGEARGIGGLFFDYLRADEHHSLEDWYRFVTDVGSVFIDSYIPIVERRKDLVYNEKQRYFQEIRRGRYVEFNLIHDRGTLFGLKTNGRIESILMSLPPRVRWDYDFTPEPGSAEERLIDLLEKTQNWLENDE